MKKHKTTNIEYEQMANFDTELKLFPIKNGENNG